MMKINRPYIEFNNGYAMEVWYDEPTDTYTLTPPIIKNESTIMSVILQCKTIEFGRKEFIEMMSNVDRIEQLINNK
jgi:hypothetical protein